MEQGRPIGRRIVLGLLGAGALGVAAGDRLQNAESRIMAGLETRDSTGLTSLVPAGDSFRFYSVTAREPAVTQEDYRLTVGGLVDHPQVFSWSGLADLPQTRLTRDFQCVTGWRVPDVHWSGVALPDLLDHVGVRDGAKVVRFGSLDGRYTETLTLPQARRRDVLVATHMLGKPVTRAHGGPVRLYVAPMYGYKSLKWLGRIDVLAKADVGYWEALGYDVNAWVGSSNGRDDAPTS